MSAKTGESTVDLWPPPPKDLAFPIVTEPEATTVFDEAINIVRLGETILVILMSIKLIGLLYSLTASKHSMLVAVVTQSVAGEGQLWVLNKELKMMVKHQPKFLRQKANGKIISAHKVMQN